MHGQSGKIFGFISSGQEFKSSLDDYPYMTAQMLRNPVYPVFTYMCTKRSLHPNKIISAPTTMAQLPTKAEYHILPIFRYKFRWNHANHKFRTFDISQCMIHLYKKNKFMFLVDNNAIEGCDSVITIYCQPQCVV